MAISVVITTFNDEKELPALLNQIGTQKLLPNEIIIADGGSNDRTIDIINEYKDKLKSQLVVLLDGRLNISEGLNLAIRNTNFDRIAIMATGNSYEEDYLFNLNNKMDETNADICTVPFKGSEMNSFSVLYNKVFLNGKDGNRIPTNHGMLIKKDVYKRIGLYYEHFIYAGEDAEFLNRIICNDIKIEIVDYPKIVWDAPKDINQMVKQIKWYMIAQLQISGIKALLSYKRVLLQLISILLMVISIISNVYALTVLFLGILILLSYNKLGVQESAIYNYYNICCVFFLVKNLKYAANDYRVKKSIIPRL